MCRREENFFVLNRKIIFLFFPGTLSVISLLRAAILQLCIYGTVCLTNFFLVLAKCSGMANICLYYVVFNLNTLLLMSM